MFGPALTLVLALVSSTVIAVPMVDNVYKRAVASLNPLFTVLPFHFPESVYENTPYISAVSFSFSETDDVKTATDYISNKLNLGESDFKVFNSFTDPSGVTHVYGAHMVNGARIANHHASVHVKNGQVTYFSSSFGTDQHFSKRDLIISEAKATLDFEQVSATASTQLDIPVHSEFEHVLEYVEQPDGKVVYAYKFQLCNNPATKWVQVWSDATTGRVIQAVDFVKRASYKVIAIPHHKHGETTPSTSDGVFDTKFNSTEQPYDDANVVAAAVNLFYLNNIMHDITYQYGFTESAGNFQKDNFGKGGKGGDAVIINVINAFDFNNANFIVPADGQSGIMNMYRFIYTGPNRSGGLDNGIPIHEYVHGVSSRLTGGSATASCLITAEAQGLGEGWSDVIAMIVLAKSLTLPPPASP
ncbi:hypothetical protein BASA62_009387 [Batrachochytrium salamandrivorans]|nr:hypothetical protein BASA62_009387 [Batrachochytrium salamandrivorans]